MGRIFSQPSAGGVGALSLTLVSGALAALGAPAAVWIIVLAIGLVLGAWAVYLAGVGHGQQTAGGTALLPEHLRKRSVSELEDYLKSINEAMERHGFGRNPGLREREAKTATLAEWLGAREDDIRRLQADLVEELAHFDFKRADSTQRAFWRVNEEVAHRLRLDAREWADQFEENPNWFAPEVTRITPEQFQEVARLMGYTANQIAAIRAQGA